MTNCKLPLCEDEVTHLKVYCSVECAILGGKLLNWEWQQRNRKRKIMNKPLPCQDYEIRKFFEAAIDDLGQLEGVDRLELRGQLKGLLIRRKIINYSTRELTDDQMKSYAEAMNKFFVRMNNTPPAERGVLDFSIIFNEILQ